MIYINCNLFLQIDPQMINDCLCVKKFSKVHMGRYVDI